MFSIDGLDNYTGPYADYPPLIRVIYKDCTSTGIQRLNSSDTAMPTHASSLPTLQGRASTVPNRQVVNVVKITSPEIPLHVQGSRFCRRKTAFALDGDGAHTSALHHIQEYSEPSSDCFLGLITLAMGTVLRVPTPSFYE